MYKPNLIKTDNIVLPQGLEALTEQIAWAVGRMSEGWTYGPIKDEEKKENPLLVPYDELPESEKAYDRNTAMETLKLVVKLGYTIKKTT